MEIRLQLQPANPDSFTGTAYTHLMASADQTASVKLYYVRFEPGARTNWHTHSGPQIIVVRAGRCRYHVEDGPKGEIGPGESVRFEPGKRHWHGATSDTFAEHIAVNLNCGETDWLEPVTEPDYLG